MRIPRFNILRLFEKHRRGWYIDEPDERDYDYKSISYATNIKKEVDLTPHLGRVFYQGNAPSCVAHAIVHQMLVEEAQLGLDYRPLSRAYIYAMSRKRHQKKGLQITGTYPRMAYKGIQELGCPPEKYWKYSTNKKWLCTPPDYRAMQYAGGRMGLKYYRIKNNFFDEMRRALTEGHPVNIGTQVTDSMHRYRYPEILYPPERGTPLKGGHYMSIMGYKGNAFLLINSWRGKERIWVDEEYLYWKWSGDFYVCKGWKLLSRQHRPINRR